jgi:hypothetical protein
MWCDEVDGRERMTHLQELVHNHQRRPHQERPTFRSSFSVNNCQQFLLFWMNKRIQRWRGREEEMGLRGWGNGEEIYMCADGLDERQFKKLG